MPTIVTIPRYFRPGATVTIDGYPVPNPDGRGHRIVFRVRKSLISEPDSAEIHIYGIAPGTRAALAATFAELGFGKVTLDVGYDRVLGSLFIGDIRRLQASTFAHADVPVIIVGDDAGDALANATLPPTLASTLGFKARDMITAAILAFAQPVLNPSTGRVISPGTVIIEDASVGNILATATPAAVSTVYTFVSVGTARDLLDEAARLLKCRWWIRDSTLYMARAALPIDGLAFQLPRTHWLTEPAELGDGLIQVDTFLDPNLLPGRQVQLVGRNSPPPRIATKLGLPPVGVEQFRIEAATYSGDTHGDSPWRASLTLARLVGGLT